MVHVRRSGAGHQRHLAYVVSESMRVVWLDRVSSIGNSQCRGLAGCGGHSDLARLYNIDLIINRTLVYARSPRCRGPLLRQHRRAPVALPPLTGEVSQLVVVASTLAIAALFNPLRRRIQGFIDRSFYVGSTMR